MKVVGKLYGHLTYFTVILNILWSLGIFCGHFGKFFPFWYVLRGQIWQPWWREGNASRLLETQIRCHVTKSRESCKFPLKTTAGVF
jgi:hypothetical protein